MALASADESVEGHENGIVRFGFRRFSQLFNDDDGNDGVSKQGDMKSMKKNGFYKLKSPDVNCGDDWFLHLLTADETPIHIVISLGSNKSKHLKYINVTVWKDGCQQEVVIYSKEVQSFSFEIENQESALWGRIWSFCNAFGYKTEGITINHDNEQTGNWNLLSSPGWCP